MKRSIARPKVALQEEAADCGFVCLEAATAVLGARVLASGLKAEFGSTTRGLSIVRLRDMLRTRGFTAAVAAIDLDRSDVLRPGSVALRSDGHFIVIGHAGRRGGRDIFDPALGWTSTSDARLRGSLSGVVLELERGPACEPERPRPSPLRGWLAVVGAARLAVRVVPLALVAFAAQLGIPMVTQHVLDAALSHRDADTFAIALIAYAALAAFASACGLASRASVAVAAASLRERIGTDLTRRLLSLPLTYFARRAAATVAGKLQAAQEIESLLARVAGGTLVQVLAGIAAIGLLVALHPWLAAASLLSLGGTVTLARGFSDRLRALAERRFASAVATHSEVVEAITCIQTIRLFHREQAIADRLACSNRLLSQRSLNEDRVRRLQDAGANALAILDRVIFLVLGGWLLMHGTISVGVYLAAGLYRELARAALVEALEVHRDYQSMTVAADRLTDLISAEPAITGACATGSGEAKAIELRGVSFAYSRFEAPVLDRLTLEIRPGECVAIVGPSGAGKSTLAKLLVGALAPDAGQIRIGGCALGTADGDRQLRDVATVMQSDHLITASIRDNIAFFRPCTDAEIEAVARAARIHDVVMALPMRYETRISDQFEGLSGGQRQRILIARALLGRPAVLIMDEATSSLDTETECAIAEQIRAMPVTRVIFAHREETIRRADRIVALQLLQGGHREPAVPVAGLAAGPTVARRSCAVA